MSAMYGMWITLIKLTEKEKKPHQRHGVRKAWVQQTTSPRWASVLFCKMGALRKAELLLWILVDSFSQWVKIIFIMNKKKETKELKKKMKAKPDHSLRS